MLVFGYPIREQINRPYTKRYDEKFILFENQYHRLSLKELKSMFARQERGMSNRKDNKDSFGQAMYFRKFDSDFSVEMTRSVRMILKQWLE